MTAPERISVAIHNGNLIVSADGKPLSGYANHPYILATPAALAASPEVQALIAAAETRGWNEAIEAGINAATDVSVFSPTAPQGEINLAVFILSRVEKTIRSLKKEARP